MNVELYEIEADSKTRGILEELRALAAEKFGVTQVGNRLTLRWRDELGLLKEAHMVIITIDDGLPDEDELGFLECRRSE